MDADKFMHSFGCQVASLGFS